MNVRTRLPLLLATATALSLAACRTDDPLGPVVVPPGDADIATDILANRTLYAETTYTIKGFVHVGNGATLTIEPGTRILGDFATLGSSLFILRGARISAVGTADAPIVFTSSQPAGSRAPGDWGGLIIIGNGIINRVVTGGLEIEGTGTVTGSTPGTNYRVTYDGGTTNTDNSGELRYVRVEYAGYGPSLNNELNSFTFGAVGSGTRLSYLQAMAGLDDSFEFFGGAADANHLVSYEAGDDHFDMSEGYVGRLQYLIALQTTQLTARTGAGTPSSDPQGIENDGCSGTGCASGFDTAPFTVPLVANFTLIGTGETATSGSSGGVGMMLRRGTGGYYVNGILGRWPRGGTSLRDAETFARAGSTGTPDPVTADLLLRNIVHVETPSMFQTGGSSVQNSLDVTANALTLSASLATAVFTAFPATFTNATATAALDWTPAAGAAGASGGLATFTGKMATKATGASPTGHAFAGTTFMGAAAPGGIKWWQGWTVYARN
ncbi:MAG: hypothetical protein WD801_07160 [Gemmatimonadaceae bacterium]